MRRHLLTEGDVQRQSRVHAQLLPVSGPAPELYVSELVRMECLVVPVRNGDAALRASYERFFATPRLVAVPMDRRVFDRALDIRVRHRFKTPDALHAAAALEAGCDELWTNDRRFAALEPAIRVVVVS